MELTQFQVHIIITCIITYKNIAYIPTCLCVFVNLFVFLGYGVEKNYSSITNSTVGVSAGVSTSGVCFNKFFLCFLNVYFIQIYSFYAQAYIHKYTHKLKYFFVVRQVKMLMSY